MLQFEIYRGLLLILDIDLKGIDGMGVSSLTNFVRLNDSPLDKHIHRVSCSELNRQSNCGIGHLTFAQQDRIA